MFAISITHIEKEKNGEQKKSSQCLKLGRSEFTLLDCYSVRNEAFFRGKIDDAIVFDCSITVIYFCWWLKLDGILYDEMIWA